MTTAQEQFQIKLSKGRVGERAIIEALSKITEVKDVTEYENFKGYQGKGIDFSFYNRKTGVWDRGDAKANIMESGLTFMELYKSNGSQGWFNTSKSDYIFCYSPYTKEIYYYDLADMRKYINERIEKKNITMSHLDNGCIGVWLPVSNSTLFKKLKT